jgi:hypothetical protein
LRLSERDWEILDTLFRVHLATGSQFHRLFFTHLSQAMSVRSRVLKRLTEWRAINVLDRRIGGPSGGSRHRVYVLDPAAKRLMELRTGVARKRQQKVDGGRLVAHMLAVSELYVQCVETSRTGAFDLLEFLAEPDCWWPLENGGYLKPDAYACVSVPSTPLVDHWWIEADLGTERMPVIRAQLSAYVNFANSGQSGPGGVVPGVIITTPDDARCAALKRAVKRLGSPATELIQVITFDSAAAFLAAHATTERRNPS